MSWPESVTDPRGWIRFTVEDAEVVRGYSYGGQLEGRFPSSIANWIYLVPGDHVQQMMRDLGYQDVWL